MTTNPFASQYRQLVRKYRINDNERRMWILNDEGLYNWWRVSRQTIKAFIADNRHDITVTIINRLEG